LREMFLPSLNSFTASDARATSRVGTSSAGPRPNAVRPYHGCEGAWPER
jgi:hypothetical protein